MQHPGVLNTASLKGDLIPMVPLQCSLLPLHSNGLSLALNHIEMTDTCRKPHCKLPFLKAKTHTRRAWGLWLPVGAVNQNVCHVLCELLHSLCFWWSFKHLQNSMAWIGFCYYSKSSLALENEWRGARQHKGQTIKAFDSQIPVDGPSDEMTNNCCQISK